jgi:2'-5' RNA ligase
VARDLPLPAGARLTLPENFHVTLAFVGEIPSSQLAVLQEIGRQQCVRAFALRFDAYEYWPTSEVVVAAARTIPVELQALWRALHDALGVHRLALEPERFRPHVTLARKVSQAPVLQAMSGFDWPVTQFSLMRSDTGGMHSAYTVVDTWSLLDKTAKT